VHHGGTTQLTLTLSRHFGEDVAFKRVFALEAGGSFLEALGGATVYFSFCQC
jgi:hypothetical protein